mgnify:FL=1
MCLFLVSEWYKTLVICIHIVLILCCLFHSRGGKWPAGQTRQFADAPAKDGGFEKPKSSIPASSPTASQTSSRRKKKNKSADRSQSRSSSNSSHSSSESSDSGSARWVWIRNNTSPIQCFVPFSDFHFLPSKIVLHNTHYFVKDSTWRGEKKRFYGLLNVEVNRRTLLVSPLNMCYLFVYKAQGSIWTYCTIYKHHIYKGIYTCTYS